MNQNYHLGYTLIELIAVIIILGIIAASAVGRFADQDSFASRLDFDEWRSALRFAQAVALSRANADTVLEIRFNRVEEQWGYSLFGDADEIYPEVSRTQERTVTSSTSDFSSACTSLTSVSYPFSVYFNPQGNRADNSGASVSANLRLCIGDFELCIDPSGYTYDGACI